MQQLEIYCNYGVLANEKKNVYTYGGKHSHAVCSESITVEVPDEWEIAENTYGEKFVIAPWGTNYTINQVLQGDDKPCFYALDNYNKGHRVFLNIIK